MTKTTHAKLPGIGLVATMNILFIALPLASLLYATISVKADNEYIKTKTAQHRPGREKLGDFYGPFAAMGVSLLLAAGMAAYMRLHANKKYAEIRKFDPYVRRPTLLLLGVPGILAAGAVLLIVVADIVVNHIMNEPSWIQRGIEKVLGLT